MWLPVSLAPATLGLHSGHQSNGKGKPKHSMCIKTGWAVQHSQNLVADSCTSLPIRHSFGWIGWGFHCASVERGLRPKDFATEPGEPAGPGKPISLGAIRVALAAVYADWPPLLAGTVALAKRHATLLFMDFALGVKNNTLRSHRRPCSLSSYFLSLECYGWPDGLAPG